MSPFFSSQNYKRDYGGGRRELTLCMRSGKGSYVPMLNLTDKIAGLCLRRELPFFVWQHNRILFLGGFSALLSIIT